MLKKPLIVNKLIAALAWTFVSIFIDIFSWPPFKGARSGKYYLQIRCVST